MAPGRTARDRRGARRRVSAARPLRRAFPAGGRSLHRELQSRGRARRRRFGGARRRDRGRLVGRLGPRRPFSQEWDEHSTVCMMSVAKGVTGDLLQHGDRPRADRSQRADRDLLARVRAEREAGHHRPHGARPHRGDPGADRRRDVSGRVLRLPGLHPRARGAGAAVAAGHPRRVPRPQPGLPARRDHAPGHRHDHRPVPQGQRHPAARRRVLDRRDGRAAAGPRRRSAAQHRRAAVRGQGRGAPRQADHARRVAGRRGAAQLRLPAEPGRAVAHYDELAATGATSRSPAARATATRAAWRGSTARPSARSTASA